MSWWQAIFLSIIQGLTEFLPISSSGHLVIFQKIFGLQSMAIFDIFIHLGTLLAIIFFFRKELLKILKGLFKKEKDSWQIFWLIVVGTIPAIIFGLFLEKNINQIFNSLRLVGFSLLITSALLLTTIFFKKKGNRDFKSMKWFDALVIGLFQALAILPGVSRSGATLSGGIFRKIDREKIFQFSFFLAIPAIIGAVVLQIPDIMKNQFNLLNQSVLGMLIAGFVGYFSLNFLKKVLINSQLWFFGIYCFLIGFLLLFF